MRVLGVDPGLTRCGLGIVENGTAQKLVMVGVGVIQTSTDIELAHRLLELETQLLVWIKEYKPDVIAVERVFSQLNIRTAMSTGQAAGVALLIAARAGIPVAMHTPTEVKAAVTGSGRADKKQVALMVQKLLSLKEIPKPVDSTDALALAICHHWRGSGNARIELAVAKEKARLAKGGQEVIASVSGVVKATTLNSAVIEVGGVGIQVSLPARFAAALVVGTHADIFTTLVVREDSLTLFGFDRSNSRDFFELLQSVSGIGPKVAQSALSIYEPEELASAIASENSAALERIPGLGKKGAQRTVLELKDKVSDLARTQSAGSGSKSHWRTQLQSALIGLGFTARDAESTIDSVASDLGAKVDETDISELLKLALQNRGRG